MKRLETVSVKRPWHWGIAIVSDPSLGSAIPDVDPGRPVSANRNGVVVLVRHAQDQVASFDDGFDWAEATVTVRYMSDETNLDEGTITLFEGVIDTPTGRLSIGDADGDVQTGGLTKTSKLRISALLDDLHSPTQVWVDVWEA